MANVNELVRSQIVVTKGDWVNKQLEECIEDLDISSRHLEDLETQIYIIAKVRGRLQMIARLLDEGDEAIFGDVINSCLELSDVGISSERKAQLISINGEIMGRLLAIMNA